MRHFLFILLVLLFVGCGTEDNNTVETEDKYYVQYSAQYDKFHTHYIKYRDENGDLISKTIIVRQKSRRLRSALLVQFFKRI